MSEIEYCCYDGGLRGVEADFVGVVGETVHEDEVAEHCEAGEAEEELVFAFAEEGQVHGCLFVMACGGAVAVLD